MSLLLDIVIVLLLILNLAVATDNNDKIRKIVEDFKIPF